MAWLTDVLHEMRHRAERSWERARGALEQGDEAYRDLERSHAETALLFRLAAATSNSQAPNEIFEPVFEGVRELLGAERASILLYDADGVMRFKAWRGLSESYRATLEGHSMWARDEPEPVPIVIADVERDERLVSYRPTFAAERIRALAFIPLCHRRRLLGKLMLYWTEPRTLSDHERDLALSLTSHVAQALDRAASREQLRRTEAKLNVALDAGRMGVWVWETTTGRVTWSVTLEEIHGLSPGTFEGTFEAYQRDIHPEDKERVLGTIRETYENQRDHHLEYRIVRPDGEVRWVAARGKVISDTEGQSSGMTGICMDVTEQKHAEQAREAAVIELERAVRFNEMFTGVLGHDLRNPLNAVTMAARVALSQNEGEKLVKPLSRIVRSTERMTRMIDQLLDFTRLRMGSGIPVEPRPVELLAVLRQVIDELDDAHPRHSLRLDHDGDSQGRWDADRLAQVFSNLIANALEHGVPEQGVDVRVDGSARDRLNVDVHNMGFIPAALIPKLFEPLVGGDRKPNGAQGLGLGLFISRAIVTAHGGSIDVRSDETSGTTFRVVLPRG